MSKTQGYALPDLLLRLNAKVIDTKLPNASKAHILAKLADIEYRCAFATNPDIQLSSLVAAFVTAAFEAELLQILTAAGTRSSRHVPQYVAHSSTRSGSKEGGGVVRLAMSYVKGGALDRWLYGISDEEHKTVDVVQLVDGHLPGGQQGSWLLSDACRSSTSSSRS